MYFIADSYVKYGPHSSHIFNYNLDVYEPQFPQNKKTHFILIVGELYHNLNKCWKLEENLFKGTILAK